MIEEISQNVSMRSRPSRITFFFLRCFHPPEFRQLRRLIAACADRALALAKPRAHKSWRAAPPQDPPQRAQQKMDAATRDTTINMQKLKNRKWFESPRRTPHGESPMLHSTEPTGSPRAGASSIHSGFSSVWTSELLSSQSRSSNGRTRSS